MYCPLVGRSRQPRMCISVDLPDPEGPVTATNSPGSTSKSAPRSARTVTSPTTYVLTRFLTEITGAMVMMPCFAAARPAPIPWWTAAADSCSVCRSLAAAPAATATAPTGTAASRLSALRAHQRVVLLLILIGVPLLESGGHAGHNFGVGRHFGLVQDFRERTVAHAEAQPQHLQLLVLVLPRGAAGLLNLNRGEQRVDGGGARRHRP